MREIVALSFFILLAAPAYYMALKKLIPLPLTITLLGFSLITAIAACNYDLISRISWGGFQVETAKREIAGIKQAAVNDIKEQIDAQKESIRLLLSTANTTSEKLQKQNEELVVLIRKASGLEGRIEEQKKKLVALNESADTTRKRVEELNHASEQIALILTRITYLTLGTKGEFGTPRAKKVVREVEKDLTKLSHIVIPNDDQQAAFVKDLSTIISTKD
jgi:hypothetical protein